MLASSSRNALRRAVHAHASSSSVAATTSLRGATNGQRCLSTSQAYSSERASYNQRSSSRSSFAGQQNRGRLGDQGSENRLRGQPYRNAPDTAFRHYPSRLARYNDELGNVISNSHLTPALRICVEMREKGVKPDLTTYHFLLRGLAEHAMHAECLAVLEDMERMGVVPDQMAYHYIMESAMSVEAQAVWDILNIMAERGIQPNEQTYEILIKRHCLSMNLEHALQSMLDLDNKGLSATLGTAQAVIDLACRMGYPRIALDVADAFETTTFRRLEGSDWFNILTASANDLWADGTVRSWQKITRTLQMTPDEGTCTLVLNTAARHGLYTLADEVVRTLQKIKVPWKEQHFAPLVEALARANLVKEAFGALHLMRAAGVEPTPETARPIADAIRVSVEAVDEAWAVLDEMHGQGQPIDVPAFNAVLSASISLGDLQRALGVYKSASAVGVNPDIQTFNILLQGCVNAKHRALGDQLLGEMRELAITPTRETYANLINLCLYERTYEDAFFYLEEMKAQGHIPPPAVYESLVRKCLSRADDRWKLALEEMRQCGYEGSKLFQEFIKSKTEPGFAVSEEVPVAGRSRSRSLQDSVKEFLHETKPTS